MCLPLIAIIFLSKNLFAQTPTFNGDVASIIFNHCTTCHRPGNIAPFSLTNINEVMAAAFSINTVVNNRVMPPWAPDPHYNHLAFERALADSEIQIITDWIAAGMPEGDTALLPDLPNFDNLNSLGIPEYEFQIPDFTILSAQDDYRCFVLHSGFSTEKFIQAVEVIPGNKEAVHHVQVFWDTTGVCQQLDDNDSLPGYTNFFGVGPVPEHLMQIWIPGESLYKLPPQFGFRIPANADFIFQVHYAPGFAGVMDSTRVRFYLNNNSSVRFVSFRGLINYTDIIDGSPFIIPADSVSTFFAGDTVGLNYSFIGIFPHMHLLGKSMKGFGVTPLGDTIPFYDIPAWNFNWQNIYLFRKVLKIPVGTVLYCEASYDNTSDNFLNPHIPP